MRRAARHDGLFAIDLTGPADVRALCGAVAEVRGSLDGFDMVVTSGPGTDPEPYADAGATWFLTQFGPYRMDPDEIRRAVAAGPRST